MTTINDVKTKKAIDYNNGKVYKIQAINNIDNDPVYIGSTTKKYLSQRMTKHRNSYNLWKNGKGSNVTLYRLFEKYGLDGCEIVLIENVNCQSKDELLQREKYHIQNSNCVNKYIPLRTHKEYKNDNYDKFNLYYKEYSKINFDIIKEHKQQYNKNNADRIKEQMKQYANDNKIVITKYKTQYYQDNKDRIKEEKTKQMKCDCGSLFQLNHKCKHVKSLKHLAYIEQQQKMEN